MAGENQETCMIDGRLATLVLDAPVSLHGHDTNRHGVRYPPQRIALCAEHAREYHGVDPEDIEGRGA